MIKLCSDCKHHRLAEQTNYCVHPSVMSYNPEALSGDCPHGARCVEERSRSPLEMFTSCGMPGKLWEAKP